MRTLTARALTSMLGELPHDDEPAGRALRSYQYNCLVDVDQHMAAVPRALVAASAIDLLPTVLAACGVDDSTRAERYPALRGHDLGPVLGGLRSWSMRRSARTTG